MSGRTIEIVVAADGTVKVTAKGYPGGACLKATRPFEEAVGSVVSDLKTPEFYQQEKQADRVKAR